MKAVMFTIIIISTTFFTACASGIMQGYIGKNIEEAILDYGPPSNIIDLSDGRRAYQLVRGKLTTLPSFSRTSTYGNSSTSITGQAKGDRFNANSNTSGSSISSTSNSGSMTVEGRCVYTLIAAFYKDKKAWIIEEFRKPDFLCE